MSEQKRYSCVKKTKKTFEESLASLAREYPLNKITVKSLCEKAQLSRNAFYFHYEDIYDLVDEIENDFINEVCGYLDDFREMGFPKNVLATIKRMVVLFGERKNTALMLLDPSFPSTLVPRLSKIFSDFNFEYYKAFHHTDNRSTYDLFYMFISTGFYGMMREWLLSEDPIPVDRFVSLNYILIKRLLVLGEPEIEYGDTGNNSK